MKNKFVIVTISTKAEYKWGDQMEAAQRIRLIRIIEKMEKNPAFSNKISIKNTSEYLAEKEQKMKDTYQNEFQKEKKCYRYYLQFV